MHLGDTSLHMKNKLYHVEQKITTIMCALQIWRYYLEGLELCSDHISQSIDLSKVKTKYVKVSCLVLRVFGANFIICGSIVLGEATLLIH